MKTKVLLASLLLFLVVTVQKGFCIILAGDYTLVNQTKRAVLIVAGRVSDIQYVQPNNGYIYTDVTITVFKTLKGEPNIDKNTVRFRIEWSGTTMTYYVRDDAWYWYQADIQYVANTWNNSS